MAIRQTDSSSKLSRFLLSILLALVTPRRADSQIITSQKPCVRSSECDYPSECCFYKEYKSRFSLEANVYIPVKQVSGKCCIPGGGGGSGGGGAGGGNFFGGQNSGNTGNSYNSYNSRFSSLNMSVWYFWFIIIFVLLSCLGLCGYWRRRQWILSFQNSHRSLPIGQQQQQQQLQNRHHHHYQLPLTHPLSLTTGGGSLPPNRPSPLPPLSMTSPVHQNDFVSGVGLPIADPVSNPLQRHHSHQHPHHRDPRGFVAPPDFNLYAAHASIRTPVMFAPAPTRVASQLYSVTSSSTTTHSAAPGIGDVASGVHPPLLPAPIVSGNAGPLGGVVGVSGCVGGRANVVTPVGLPPSYVEAVSGAAESKYLVAGSPSNINDKKMADLPPSYAEAVAQMMHPPLGRTGEIRGGVVDVSAHGGGGPLTSIIRTPATTALTHERIQSSRSSGVATPRSLTFRGNAAATTNSDNSNSTAIYDPITSFGVGGDGGTSNP